MADDYRDFKQKEELKQSLRREDRKNAQFDREDEYRTRKRDRDAEIEARHRKGLEKQEERHNMAKNEFDRRQSIKNQELLLKEEAKLSGLSQQLGHSSDLSQQEHKQGLELERERLRNEISIRSGEHKAEAYFIQERYKGELTLQKERANLELKRVEIQAKWDYQESLDLEQERTSREISLAKEQTKRELAVAQENNHHALVIEKEKHLHLLEQKSQELEHYQERIRADSEALTRKEDEAMERRMRESRHAFGQELQKIQAEVLQRKIESQLKREEFSHEQDKLLETRYIAKKLGLSDDEISREKITEYVTEFNESDEGDDEPPRY